MKPFALTLLGHASAFLVFATALAVADDIQDPVSRGTRREGWLAGAIRPAGEAAKRALLPPLPPLPEGVQELKFPEFFNLPVGPRGLEMTDRLKALDGQRVRVLGHMVKEDLTPCNSCPVAPKKGKRALPAWMEFVVPGRMMFTEHPALVSHAHYGLADDLPPQTIFVTVPDKFGELVPYTPGPMLLTGVLSIGNKPESDGRVSVVRLTLDPPAKNTAAAAPQSALSITQPALQQAK